MTEKHYFDLDPVKAKRAERVFWTSLLCTLATAGWMSYRNQSSGNVLASLLTTTTIYDEKEAYKTLDAGWQWEHKDEKGTTIIPYRTEKKFNPHEDLPDGYLCPDTACFGDYFLENTLARALAAYEYHANIKFVRDEEGRYGPGICFFISPVIIGSNGEPYGGLADGESSYGVNVFISFAHKGLTPAQIESSFAAGTKSYEDLLHEIGHALGLKHPFQESPLLSKDLDNRGNTLMSYTDDMPARIGFRPYMPRRFDIQMLQAKYGVNPRVLEGAAVLELDNFPNGEFVFTDPDGNGSIRSTNTLHGTDVINLNEGRENSSKVAGTRFWITEGSGFLNVVSGGGSVIGNNLDNNLNIHSDSGDVNCRVMGGAGNDILEIKYARREFFPVYGFISGDSGADRFVTSPSHWGIITAMDFNPDEDMVQLNGSPRKVYLRVRDAGIQVDFGNPNQDTLALLGIKGADFPIENILFLRGVYPDRRTDIKFVDADCQPLQLTQKPGTEAYMVEAIKSVSTELQKH